MPDAPQTQPPIHTQCVIAGGGPAGMMLAFLLGRAGIHVTLLEKHADFLRDFRGDTIHPSTLQLLHELGILDDFLQLPHQELTHISGRVQGIEVLIADFRHLPTHAKFIALMPQWDFLNFLASHAKQFPTFNLIMQANVSGLITEHNRITGLIAQTPQGPIEIRAELTVGADGRHSTLRQLAHLEVIDRGAPIDVLWMRLTRRPTDPEITLGHFIPGNILVTINRADYWQCALVIPKGGLENIQQQGLPGFQQTIARIAPFLKDRTAELDSWDKIKLLTVAVDHLRHWSRPGLLCIGDSAHAMSPIGGVGINLAIQDAVAAANLLAAPLAQHAPITNILLQKIQHRREFPTRLLQSLQVFAHKRILAPALTRTTPLTRLPLAVRLLKNFPYLRRLPARLVGIGPRPEHIRTPRIAPPPR